MITDAASETMLRRDITSFLHKLEPLPKFRSSDPRPIKFQMPWLVPRGFHRSRARQQFTPSCKAHVEGSGKARTEKEKSGTFSSIRIVLDWRRKHPAVDASGVSRADRTCLTLRRAKRLRVTGIPRFADVGSPVLFRRGLCRRDHGNNRQRSCVHRQCEEPYRKFAHASLPLMRKLSWIGSLGRYSYSTLVCCGRMAASALLPRKPARGCNRSRAFSQTRQIE
jgi:hypothetical protein